MPLTVLWEEPTHLQKESQDWQWLSVVPCCTQRRVHLKHKPWPLELGGAGGPGGSPPTSEQQHPERKKGPSGASPFTHPGLSFREQIKHRGRMRAGRNPGVGKPPPLPPPGQWLAGAPQGALRLLQGTMRTLSVVTPALWLQCWQKWSPLAALRIQRPAGGGCDHGGPRGRDMGARLAAGHRSLAQEGDMRTWSPGDGANPNFSPPSPPPG